MRKAGRARGGWRWTEWLPTLVLLGAACGAACGRGSGPVPDVVSGPVPGAVGVAVGASPAAGRAEPAWAWPTGSDVVVNGWDPPATEYGAGHRGIDVRAEVGSIAVAVDDGVVTFAGPVAGRPVVTIDHGGGLRSTLDAVAPSVAVGDVVGRGSAVGTVAPGSVSPGHCGGDPCLHVGARLDDVYVDPLRYLGRPAWPVLLPLP